jgi:hypothetical protein
MPLSSLYGQYLSLVDYLDNSGLSVSPVLHIKKATTSRAGFLVAQLARGNTLESVSITLEQN